MLCARQQWTHGIFLKISFCLFARVRFNSPKLNYVHAKTIAIYLEIIFCNLQHNIVTPSLCKDYSQTLKIHFFSHI